MDQMVYKHFEKKRIEKEKSVEKIQQSESWETDTLKSETIDSGTSEDNAKKNSALDRLIQKWENKIKDPEDHPIMMVDQLWLWIIDHGIRSRKHNSKDFITYYDQ